MTNRRLSSRTIESKEAPLFTLILSFLPLASCTLVSSLILGLAIARALAGLFLAAFFAPFFAPFLALDVAI